MVTDRLNTAAADTDLAPRPGARALLAALAVYFLLQLLVRVTVAGGVEKDEAEQLLWTQTWPGATAPNRPSTAGCSGRCSGSPGRPCSGWRC
jgi:hypothetical protein